VLLALASISSSAAAAPARISASSAQARPGRVDIRLFDLTSVRRLFHTLARRGDAMTEGERAAALADFSVMTEAIEGGCDIFPSLLRMFGGVELALVAYNAGPGFAQRYARGQAVLYGETREYVKRVLSRLNAAR
jgi:hypothetical protein